MLTFNLLRWFFVHEKMNAKVYYFRIRLFINQLDESDNLKLHQNNSLVDNALICVVNKVSGIRNNLFFRPCSAAGVCVVLQRGPEKWFVVQWSVGGHVRLHCPAVWEQRGEMVSVINFTFWRSKVVETFIFYHYTISFLIWQIEKLIK